MKKTQKKLQKRKTAFGAGIAAAILAVSTLLSSSQLIAAEEKVQSAERIEVNLTHSHTSVCNQRTFVSCGGHWCTNFEPYVGATVYYCSNNMAIPEIHDNYTLTEHSGTHDGEYVTRLNCSMSSIGKLVIEKTQTEAGVVLQAFVEDPDNFISDYAITWENVSQDLDENTGEGDSSDAGNASNEGTEDTTTPTLTINRNGVYTATISVTDAKTGVTHEQSLSYTDVSFPIHLYLKSDGNIIAETDLYYGQALPEVEVPFKTGYTFEGYECNGGMIYDENGAPMPNVSTFWDDMEYESNAVWTAKTYTIHYGPDEDEDGVGDLEMQVTFGETYPAIDPLEDQGNSTFTGYYYGNEQIYDREGNPTGVWSWDVEDGFTLQPKYDTPTGDAGTDSDSSNDSNATKPQPSPTPSPTPLPDVQNPEDENGSISENGIPQGDSGVPSNPSGNNEGDRGNAGGNTNVSKENENSRNPWENNNYWGYGRNENGIGMYPRLNRNGKETRQDDSQGGESGISRPEESDNNMDAEMQEVDMKPLFSDNDAMEANTLNSHGQKEQIKKVVLITSSTIAGVASVGGIVYSFFLFWISACIYTITPERKKKRLGYVVVNHGADGFKMSISQKMLDRSDTGNILIRMPKGFVRNQIGKEILIHLPNRNITDVIREEVTFSIR